MNQRLTVQVSTALAFGPTGIIWAFLPIHLRSLGASYLLIALVSLIPAIETIGLSPAWGGILDKTGRGNKILLISLLAQGIGFSVFPSLQGPEEISGYFQRILGTIETEEHRDSLSTLHNCPGLNVGIQQLLHSLPCRRSKWVPADSRASGHGNDSAWSLCVSPSRAAQ